MSEWLTVLGTVAGTVAGGVVGLVGSQLVERRRESQETSLQNQFRRQALEDRRTEFDLGVLADIQDILEQIGRTHVHLVGDHVEVTKAEERSGQSVRADCADADTAVVFDLNSRLRLRAAHLHSDSELYATLNSIANSLQALVSSVSDRTRFFEASGWLTKGLGDAAPQLANHRSVLLRQQDDVGSP